MMTTEQDFTFEDPTETTPSEITHQTAGGSMASSSPGSAGLYVQCAFVVITTVGAGANALVLYAMIASKQHKKHVLIFNQNALDFVNCMCLSVYFSLNLCNIYLSGTVGYWLCVTVVGGTGAWGTYVGSLINLAAISIERYLKVVHHIWAKNKLRKWMIHSAIAFAWIGGIVLAEATAIPTTAVVNGMCYVRRFFGSRAAQKTFAIWNFMSFYVIMLLIFIFCYGRVLMAIRRQASVMAAHSGAGSNTAQCQSNKIQTNVIKTMILVSGLFAITWAPIYTYDLLRDLLATGHNSLLFVGLMFIGYIYTFTNPFIYATKFDPVKRVLLGMIPCKKNTQPLESVDNT